MFLADQTTGTTFYYENPLATVAGKPWRRSKWFDTACCPPNVAKLIGLLPSLAFSNRDATLAVHLFISSTFTATVHGKPVTLRVETDLPWGGNVKLAIQSQEEVQLAVRIPSWTATSFKSSHTGEVKGGYLYITTGSSEIQLAFSMEPKVVFAHPKTNKDEIAVLRGPLVYCAESPDNEFDLESTYVDAKSLQETGKFNIAGVEGVPLLRLSAAVKTAKSDALYRPVAPDLKVEKNELILLPFFLRMNRGGNGAMRVWFKIDHFDS